MTIQWFPGHMTRARREIEEKLKLIDVVIELLDARVPKSSQNPMIEDILKNKPRLVLLNKADLADPEVTERWVQYYLAQGLNALPVDAASGNRIKEIGDRCKLLVKDKIDNMIRKGITPRAMRAIIVGIPNVGKSTLINRMAGRKIAITGDRPGVTKGQQWIKTSMDLELLDTPGILWPKFDDQQVGMRLATVGSVKEQILNVEEVAFFGVQYMMRHYRDTLQERYELSHLPIDASDNEQVVETMEAIGRKRGCILSGNRVDLDKMSVMFLRELRAGKLGRISLEAPKV